MLDIGMFELFVIGALALIVVGPKELPGLLRTLGQYTAKLRGMAREFQRSMEDAAREADLDDVAKAVKSGGNLNKLPFDNQVVDSLKEFEKTVKTEVSDAQTAFHAAGASTTAAAGAAAAGGAAAAKAEPDPSDDDPGASSAAEEPAPAVSAPADDAPKRDA